MNKPFFNKPTRFACLLATSAALSNPAFSEEGQEVLYDLDQFVITATRQKTLVMDSPVSVAVLGGEDLERRPNATIADMLRDVPGIRVADNTLPGMQRLRIRGEDARRSLVLIDGQEISDHSTFGPPLLIDPSMIEQVEVVRGPHSTLYGSRAAGGVINIITKQATETNFFRGSIGSGYTGATGGHHVNASIAGAQEGWNYSLSASSARHGDRKTPKGTLENSSHESDGLMGRIGYSEGNHSFSVVFDTFDMSSEATTRDDLVDGFVISDFLLDLPKRDREKLGFFYEGYQLTDKLEKLNIDAYWQTVDRNITQKIAGVRFPITTPPSFYNYYNDDFDTIDTTGLNIQADWIPADDHSFITGLSLIEDDLDKQIDRTGTIISPPTVTPANLISKTRSGIETLAFFAQDTWKASEKVSLLAGVRHYVVDSELKSSNDPLLVPKKTDDSHTIRSLALVYKAREDLTWRFSWAQGYVFPTLLHLHTGSLFGQGNLTRPNPNLQPEESENFEIGLRFQNETLTADFAVFANQADNYIASVRASNLPELGWSPRENTYANLDTAESRGVEFLISKVLSNPDFEWYAQGSYVRRELEYATFTTTHNGQPEWAGRTGIRFETESKKNMGWYVDFYGVTGEDSDLKTTRSTRHTDSWATVNLAAGIYLDGDQEWWFGIEALNLSDEAYRPSVDELWQPERHLTVGARLKF